MLHHRCTFFVAIFFTCGLATSAHAELTLKSDEATALIGGRTQVGYVAQPHARADDRSNNRFLSKQTRLELTVEAWEDFSGNFVIDLFGARGLPGAKDVWVAWAPLRWLSLKLGQFKPPVSRQRVVSGRDTLFSDRPTVINRLAPPREMGMSASFLFDERRYQIHLGAFNGQRENVLVDDREGFPLFTFRFEAMPLGVMNAAEGALPWSEDFRLQLGLWGTFTRDDSAPTADEDPRTLEKSQLGADLAMRYQGFFFSAEGSARRWRDAAGNDGIAWGAYAQASYLIEAIYLEAALRFSYYDERLGHGKNSCPTISYGLNYYPFGSHLLKVNLAYTDHLPSPDSDADWDEDELSIIVQLAF